MPNEQLSDFHAAMLDQQVQVLWAISPEEKVTKWKDSKLQGPECGFTEALRKQLSQLSRSEGSGANNRRILDGLVPWFEPLGHCYSPQHHVQDDVRRTKQGGAGASSLDG